MAGTLHWDIAIIGGINADYLGRGPRLPRPGESIQGETFQEGSGGKGANQAVAAARLGARVALIGRIGSDERGTVLLEGLDRESVDRRYLIRDSGAASGVSLIMVDQRGEKAIFSILGANLRLSVADVRAAADAIRSAKVLLAQLEVPLVTVTEAVQIAHEAGATVVLDPAPAQPLPDALLRQVDLIRPNSNEAGMLTGIEVRDRDSARAAAHRLLERGAKAVCVQAGDGGNLLVWRDGEQWLPKMEVKSVDATGAGDAMAAAFAAELARGASLQSAGRFANAAAALATTKLGAQAGLPRREEVEAFQNRSAS